MNDVSFSKATPDAAPTDHFDRLTFLGWRWGLTAIVAGLALSFFLFGYAVIYWRNADMDFMVIHSALALNDGKPQYFFDHTAYLTILSTKLWFQFLHALGLLNAWSLSSIPPASDAAAFDAAMTQAVRAGRLLVLLIAVGCVLIFAALMRAVVRDWRVAMLATLAFAFSGGIAVHSRILRSELVSACPVIFALLILIIAGRRATLARPLALALAAALCMLGMENKVQVILLIGTLPFLALPFGSTESASIPFWRNTPSAWVATLASAVLAAVALWLASPLIATGFDHALFEAAQFRPILMGRYGVYQVALALMIAGCMIAYAAIWRVSAAEALTSMLAMIAAAALTLLLLNVQYDARNVIAVVNPVEKMLVFADASGSGATGFSGILAVLSQGIGSVLARYTFFLHSSPRPTVFLVWLIIPGIVLAWRRGERLVVLQSLLLLLAAIGIDALGVRRGLKSEYFIFTDPLIILSGAILLDCLSDLRFHKWAYVAGMTLFALHIAVGQAEPVKYALKRTGPESICQWNKYYVPLLPLPWCPPRP
jgi:hypothetical protein